jgi:hypothetical protein
MADRYPLSFKYNERYVIYPDKIFITEGNIKFPVALALKDIDVGASIFNDDIEYTNSPDGRRAIVMDVTFGPPRTFGTHTIRVYKYEDNTFKIEVDQGELPLTATEIIGEDLYNALRTVLLNMINSRSKNIPYNAVNELSQANIMPGEKMVNFHGEYNDGRYHTLSSYNSLPLYMGKKRNPYTRENIDPTTVVHYYAKKLPKPPTVDPTGGGRRRVRKTKKRRVSKKKMTRRR